MMTAAAFLIAAAIGAVARGLLGTSPWRIALLNIVGSFALGLVSQWTGPGLTVIGVGAIGSLTTFSTFVSHWVEEVEESERRSTHRGALALVAVSIVGGVIAAYGGIELAGS